MRKLVLLRHGESDWNRENRFTGWTDVDLSEKGRQEAKEAGAALKAESLVEDPRTFNANHPFLFFVREHQRYKDVPLLVPGEPERGRHYTHNGVAPLVQLDGLAQNRGVGTVTHLPEAMADDCYLIVAGLHLLGREIAS